MSNVTLSIGGRTFAVSCAEGEEGHIAGLGRTIDDRVAGLGDAAGHNEVRMLLYAALVLADELEELKTKATPTDTGSAPRLEAIAARIENLAARLEQQTANA